MLKQKLFMKVIKNAKLEDLGWEIQTYIKWGGVQAFKVKTTESLDWK